MICSMKACSVSSLTSPCVDGFFKYLHVIIPAQIGSSLSLRPLKGVSNLLCDDKEQEKKEAKQTSWHSYDCPALQVAIGMFFVTGQLYFIVHIPPFILPLHVLF